MKILSIKKNIYNKIVEGDLSESVCDELGIPEEVVHKECELWDYKREVKDLNDKSNLAQLVKLVVSFYNSYGGYLVFGVEEKNKDLDFDVCGCDVEVFNLSKVRDSIFDYLGSVVDISFAAFSFEKEGEEKNVGVMHIPKRVSPRPAVFSKNGPGDNAKNMPFQKGDIWFREGDAKKKNYGDSSLAFLMSPRDFVSPDMDGGVEKAVEHNLPQKSLIFKEFIGREEILGELYEWFRDDLEFVKVLAGEGGKGKTSIAYQFAVSVLRGNFYSIDSILWVTAKKKQFVASQDELTNNYRTDYFSYDDLLFVIANKLAIVGAELYEEKDLRREIKRALSVFSTLIVVDDVDTLPLDEQKKVIDFSNQVASEKSKILVTTRQNLTASSMICINVPGMGSDDYKDFCESLVRSGRFGDLTGRIPFQRLHKETSGSPLLTESIFRLVKLGLTFNEAIKDWSGKTGEDARAFTIKREIESLTIEQKRALFAGGLLRDFSRVELQQLTEYEDDQLNEVIAGLDALFLVSSERLGEEPRFTVSDHVVKIIDGFKEDVHDFRSLTKKVERKRSKVRSMTSSPEVAKVIRQANALLLRGDVTEAIKDVKSSIAGNLSNNGDLRIMLARCYERKGDYENSRKYSKEAYKLGSRKGLLFNIWNKAETEKSNWHGVIEVSEKAIKSGVDNPELWYARIAVSNINLAAVSSMSIEDKVARLRAASSNYMKCVNGGKESFSKIRDINDVILDSCIASKDYLLAIDEGIYMIRDLKDRRNTVVTSMSSAFSEALALSGNRKDGYRKAIEVRASAIFSFLRKERKSKGSDPFVTYLELAMKNCFSDNGQ